MDNYFIKIYHTFLTLGQGLILTYRHLINARQRHDANNVQASNYFVQNRGIVTLSYPFESISVPDIGRYRLHNEIEDCIVCDKCAVVCPVDCIAIEAIKSSEAIGETSDGSTKRLWASTFDIDMAKCCFCGLCTSVCPTECLTMTKVYDFSEQKIENMNYSFTNLTTEQAEEKRRNYDIFIKEKEELKRQQAEAKLSESKVNVEQNSQNEEIKATPKPAFKPIIKKT